MPKGRKFLYVKQFDGVPKESDFRLIEEDVASPKSGEIHVKALYLSVDPYMRCFDPSVGNVMIGSQVGKIVESQTKDFPVNRYVVGYFGWQTDTVTDPMKLKGGLMKPYLVEEQKDLPLSLTLGILGMPGNTAYFGMLEVCRPKEKETVVVSAAAGAVGSTAGQIALIQGCNVIGLTGTDAKVKWLTDIGFNYAFNYKTQDLDESLKKAAPKGVDCYFDNVGGRISDAVMSHMNDGGRIAECGSISTYNGVKDEKALSRRSSTKKVNVKAFSVFSREKRWNEGINANLQWIREGKLQWKETVTPGFENMPKAFIGLFTGANTGKAIVKM